MRILGHLLAIVLAVTLFGCSTDDDTTPPGGKHTGDPNGNGDSDNTGDGAGGVSIYDIQTPGGSASAVGMPVSLTNVVVTAVDRFGARTGTIYVQEQAGGAYSGVTLFSSNGIQVVNATLGTLAVGDIVNVTNGEVDEFALTSDTSGKTLTEIVSRQGLKLTVTKMSSGAPPTPVVLNPWDLAASDAEAEKWESVLIRFQDVVALEYADGVSSSDPTLAEFRVTGPFPVSSSLTALLSTDTPPESLYEKGTCFASLTGIVDYFFDYKLLPREPTDMMTGGTACPAEENLCDDEIDNDHNGYIDCADFSCQAADPDACTATTTIVEIQKGNIGTNIAVEVVGVVVTAIEPGSSATKPKYVWVEEPAGGEFSGILVYQPNAPADLAQGDIVTVTGTTAEYFSGGTGSVTEIKGTTAAPAALTRTGTGAVPTPMIVLPSLLVAPPTPNPYDGLLVKVEDVKVTNINPDMTSPDPAPYGSPNFGEWTVSSSNLRIDDLLMPTQGQPSGIVVGDCYTEIIGVFDYSFGNYKIEPRGTADLTKGAPADCP